jgi:aminopeptidase N
MQAFPPEINISMMPDCEIEARQEHRGLSWQKLLAACLLGPLILLSTACQSNQPASVLPTLMVRAEVPLSTPTLAAPAIPAVDLADAEVQLDSIGDPYIPELGNRGFDVRHYTLKLALDPALGQIQGAAWLEVMVRAEGLAQLSLDFAGFEISEITINGAAADFHRAAKKLWVALPHPLAAGTLLTAVIDYQGTPIREASPYVGFTDALGLSFTPGGTIYTLSEPDGARYWFPSNDHPRDKATYRFELTVPSGLTAVANGRLEQVKSPGLLALPGGGSGQTFIWEHGFPMATYLALVTVGPYERIEAVSPNGVPLRHYVTAPYRQEFERAIAVTGEAIDWMSALFGPYPFEAFGYVAGDLPPTAMETQTMAILANELIGRRTAIHELAHMWFGNWVGLDSWSEMWRKEGFATYIALMWETGDDPEALDRKMEEILAAVAQNGEQYPIGAPPPQQLLGYNTYFKGAAVIHALRRDIGDEAFFTGVRAYLERYGGGVASDAQFQEVMEAAAGRSLDAFFADWLN